MIQIRFHYVKLLLLDNQKLSCVSIVVGVKPLSWLDITKAPIFFFHGSDIRLMVDYCLVVGVGASPGESTWLLGSLTDKSQIYIRLVNKHTFSPLRCETWRFFVCIGVKPDAGAQLTRLFTSKKFSQWKDYLKTWRLRLNRLPVASQPNSQRWTSWLINQGYFIEPRVFAFTESDGKVRVYYACNIACLKINDGAFIEREYLSNYNRLDYMESQSKRLSNGYSTTNLTWQVDFIIFSFFPGHGEGDTPHAHQVFTNKFSVWTNWSIQKSLTLCDRRRLSPSLQRISNKVLLFRGIDDVMNELHNSLPKMMCSSSRKVTDFQVSEKVTGKGGIPLLHQEPLSSITLPPPMVARLWPPPWRSNGLRR